MGPNKYYYSLAANLTGVLSDFNISYFPVDVTSFNFVELLGFGFEALYPKAQQMVKFLNLTENFDRYLKSYYIEPLGDDGCPYGWCPNNHVSCEPILSYPSVVLRIILLL